MTHEEMKVFLEPFVSQLGIDYSTVQEIYITTGIIEVHYCPHDQWGRVVIVRQEIGAGKRKVVTNG